MKPYVLDTSAVIRLFIDDGPMPEALLEAVESASRGDAVLAAPDLLLVEVASVLLKKERAGLMPRAAVELVLAGVRSLPISYVPTAILVDDALAAARSSTLSAYDALYLALAKAFGAKLVTGDERLRRRARG